MSSRVGLHLRQHAIAYVALFVALGGTAVALPGKGSVTAEDLAKQAVTSRAIAKQAVKGKKLAKKAVKSAKIANAAVKSGKLANAAVIAGKLADGSVERAKIADNAVDGAKADEATFEGLVQGDGVLFSNAFTVNATNTLFITPFVTVAEIPGFGAVEMLSCRGDANLGAMRMRFLSSDASTEFFASGEAVGQNLPGGLSQPAQIDSSAGTLGGGGGAFVTAEGSAPTAGVAGHFEWQVSRGTGADTTGATIEIEAWNNSTDSTPLGQCRVTAQTVIQE